MRNVVYQPNRMTRRWRHRIGNFHRYFHFPALYFRLSAESYRRPYCSVTFELTLSGLRVSSEILPVPILLRLQGTRFYSSTSLNSLSGCLLNHISCSASKSLQRNNKETAAICRVIIGFLRRLEHSSAMSIF